MEKEIVGLIPVKGLSDRISMKNLRNFDNTSLFELKFHQLSSVNHVQRLPIAEKKVLVCMREIQNTLLVMCQ